MPTVDDSSTSYIDLNVIVDWSYMDLGINQIRMKEEDIHKTDLGLMRGIMTS